MRKVGSFAAARRWAGVLLAVGTWAAGCGGDSDGGPCTEGQQISCRCADGSLGHAVCEAKDVFGACQCPGETSSGGASGGGGEAGEGTLGGRAGGAGGAPPGGSGGNGGADAAGAGNGGSDSESGGAGAGNGGSGGEGLSTGGVAGTVSSGGAGGAIVDPPPLPLGPCVSKALAYGIVDADFSYSLNRVVALTSAPATVTVIDPATGTGTAIALPVSAKSISVAPSGQWAATAHDGYVSIINLQTQKLERTIATTTVAGDIVMTDRQFAYLLPESDQWVDIHSIDIAAGKDLGNDDKWSIYARTLAKLHPAGGVMYGITVGLSPTDLERYDISAGAVSAVVDSPYHGDYRMCGDLWISKDGTRIFTGCGTVFRAAPGTKDDFLYNGSFEGGPVSYTASYVSIEHDVKNKKVYALSKVAALQGATAHPQVEVYDYQFLAAEPAFPLSCFTPGDIAYPNGQFVFASRDGKQLYVLGVTKLANASASWALAVSTRQ